MMTSLHRPNQGQVLSPQSIASVPGQLTAVFGAHQRLVVAVSGGVDSLTLAWIASVQPHLRLTVMHAAGPAVPPSATARVREHARRGAWDLQVLDAGEYQNPDYRRNPVNRCYYCKSNLYQRIGEAAHPDTAIAAGTNLDDLGEYRPGLIAADEHRVIHPFVDAGMNKQAVRSLAAAFGLDDIAQLPAQPCLASRVETGIPIDANDLAFIDEVECMASDLLGPGDLRCRLTQEGVWLEVDSAMDADRAHESIRHRCEKSGRTFAGIRPYRRGSAFLTTQADERVVEIHRAGRAR